MKLTEASLREQPRYEEGLAPKTYWLINRAGQAELSSTPGTLGGHRRSRLYGRLDCAAARRAISRGGYLADRVFFADQDTAVAAGYRPCAVCLPVAYRAWKDTSSQDESDISQSPNGIGRQR